MSKGVIIKQFIRKVFIILIERIIEPFIPLMCEMRWRRKTRNVCYRGVSKNSEDVPIVVSLTTFPARIKGVDKVIKSLLVQTRKPTRVVLWLAEEQFPNKEKDLPQNVVGLEKYGLEIGWCNDLRSYKKLIPTILKYPEAIIISVDDDLYYGKKLVQKLYSEHRKYPDDIICQRASMIGLESGKYTVIPGGFKFYPGASFLNKLVGCSGVLYPIAALHEDVLKSDLFMKLAPTNDDIWFWFMGIKNGRKVRVVRRNNPYERTLKGTQQGEQLSAVNDTGEMLFWKQFYALIEHYPEINMVLNQAVQSLSEKKRY